MNVAIKNLDDTTIAEISGDIDGSTAPMAQQQVLSAIKGGSNVVLDLSNVPYMSSAGLRMLLSTYRQVTNSGGKIVFVGVVDEIKDTMEVTGFLKFFTLAETLDDAMVTLAGN
ncbi:MAG TPA: anti-sigma factor antagonist [Thermomicrobiaceae bacterium]|nr:anti-sigma factor antagonist [Thermomicrobiaceae bacterium]